LCAKPTWESAEVKMLEVENLHVSYGKVDAVRGVDVNVAAARVTLMLGANGAGKSTTLRAIAGLHRPRSGRVVLDGEIVTGLPAHRLVGKGMVLIPEGRRIFAPLSVEENLRLGAYTAGRDSYGHRLDQVYELFPILRERRRGPAGLLSGGEQQMLAFGRGLMSGPTAILMDEPSMGLSPALVDSVLACVRLIADSGIAVLVVEQNADIGLEIADDVVVLARGEVVFSGPASLARSHSSIVRAFLGESILEAEPPVKTPPMLMAARPNTGTV
jgi:branched-chain amino acid transport system ATP-binding protein